MNTYTPALVNNFNPPAPMKAPTPFVEGGPAGPMSLGLMHIHSIKVSQVTRASLIKATMLDNLDLDESVIDGTSVNRSKRPPKRNPAKGSPMTNHSELGGP